MSPPPVHERTTWQDPRYPVTGPVATPGQWQAVIYHYPGSTATPPSTLAGLLGLCRSMQKSYVTTRGYSLGYGYVIGPNGDIVEVRGLDLRNAANDGTPSKTGVKNYNPYTVSVQFVVANQSAATAAQLEAAAKLHVNLIEAHVKRELRIEGHGDKDSTPCPGAGIQGQLPGLDLLIQGVRQLNNKPTPPPIPTPSPDEGDEMIHGLWKGPNDPGVYAVVSNGTKVWCPSPGVVEAHQALLTLNGKSATVNVMTDANMFRAFGPVVGPRPGGVDEYGWR